MLLGSVTGIRNALVTKSGMNGLVEKTLDKKNKERSKRFSKVREAISRTFLLKILGVSLRIPAKPSVISDAISINRMC